MTAADIAAIVLAGGGALATLLNFLTSARNTDLEAVKAIVKAQQDQITSLQQELKEERAHSARLELLIRARDEAIEKLQHDLNAAHKRLRELEGHA